MVSGILLERAKKDLVAFFDGARTVAAKRQLYAECGIDASPLASVWSIFCEDELLQICLANQISDAIALKRRCPSLGENLRRRKKTKGFFGRRTHITSTSSREEALVAVRNGWNFRATQAWERAYANLLSIPTLSSDAELIGLALSKKPLLRKLARPKRNVSRVLKNVGGSSMFFKQEGPMALCKLSSPPRYEWYAHYQFLCRTLLTEGGEELTFSERMLLATLPDEIWIELSGFFSGEAECSRLAPRLHRFMTINCSWLDPGVLFARAA